jgi:hypothetical protein
VFTIAPIACQAIFLRTVLFIFFYYKERYIHPGGYATQKKYQREPWVGIEYFIKIIPNNKASYERSA